MDTAVLGITRTKRRSAQVFFHSGEGKPGHHRGNRLTFHVELRSDLPQDAFGQPGFDRDEYIIRPAHRLPVVREKAHRAVLFFQTFEQRRPRMRNADILPGGQSGRNHPAAIAPPMFPPPRTAIFIFLPLHWLIPARPWSETLRVFRTRARQSYCFPPFGLHKIPDDRIAFC